MWYIRSLNKLCFLRPSIFILYTLSPNTIHIFNTIRKFLAPIWRFFQDMGGRLLKLEQPRKLNTTVLLAKFIYLQLLKYPTILQKEMIPQLHFQFLLDFILKIWILSTKKAKLSGVTVILNLPCVREYLKEPPSDPYCIKLINQLAITSTLVIKYLRR